MTPDKFVSAVASFDMPGVFNPWRDHCEDFDLDDSAEIRRKNLSRFLEAAVSSSVRTMWIARDLGYRGGRRTGVPLTDEAHLEDAGDLLKIKLKRATLGPVVAERTAAVIWRVLREIHEPVVLWNVFPFHPHEPGRPMTNRCHTRPERVETWPLLEALIEMVAPDHIVAIGRDAAVALSELGVKTTPIRHPSYGGQTEFIAGMADLYGFEPAPRASRQLDFTFPD